MVLFRRPHEYQTNTPLPVFMTTEYGMQNDFFQPRPNVGVKIIFVINPEAVIGYPSGQDGVILPVRDYPPLPARKMSPKAI